MGRRVTLNRRTKLINAEHERNDDVEVLHGGWTREELIRMDQKFCAAMRRAHPEKTQHDSTHVRKRSAA